MLHLVVNIVDVSNGSCGDLFGINSLFLKGGVTLWSPYILELSIKK